MPVKTQIKTLSRTVTLFAYLLVFVSCALSAQDKLKQTDVAFDTVTVVSDLPKSSSINVGSDDAIWLTHKHGGITVIEKSGKRTNIRLKPLDLYSKGQGGLIDLAFHSTNDKQAWGYFTYSAGDDSQNMLKVARFKLDKPLNMSPDIEHVFSMNETRSTPVHYGGKLLFLDDDSLLVTTGDGFDFRERAQLMGSHQGKVLRMSDTGNALTDNPFYSNRDEAVSYVYSLGHRNPQGLVVDENGQVIAHEHGPDGGDEINIIKAAVNYGWPVVTNGKDYIGSTISPFKDYPGMQLPDYDWTPSIAPSGMVLVNTNIPKHPLNNMLLVTSLKFKQVRALQLNEGVINNETLFYQSESRLRDITLDDEGSVLLLTDDANASVLKMKIRTP